MSTAKKWGVHLTWAKSMSWQHFCTHSKSECHCCAHSAGSLEYFLFYDLKTCSVALGILQVHIQNLRLNTEKKCPSYTLSAMYNINIFKSRKKQFTVMVDTYNNDDKSKR